MKIRISLFAGVFGAALLVGSAANATPTLIGTTSDPTGINNLVVDSTNYDVTFSLTTVSSPFTFGSAASVDAANALATALNTFNVTELGNDADATFYGLDVDDVLINFDEAIAGGVFGFPWTTATTTGIDPVALGGDPYWVAVDFSVASATPVPEPSSLPLLLAGLGLVGGAVYFGRKKATARI